MTGRPHVTNDLENAIQKLVEVVAEQDAIRAIGLSGGDRALPNRVKEILTCLFIAA